MKSHGKFVLEVKVPPGVDAQRKANDIMLLIREEIDDPNDFMGHLEAICKKAADFLDCKLVLTDKGGILLARFVFE